MEEKILKVISGGQTGADTGGLKAARKAGIKTGGAAPLGYLTENGANYELRFTFGLYESTSNMYVVRTKENVAKADATLIFSRRRSAGSVLTEKTCQKLGKPYLMLNPFSLDIEKMIVDFIQTSVVKNGRAITLNIAGNRESKSPGIENNGYSGDIDPPFWSY